MSEEINKNNKTVDQLIKIHGVDNVLVDEKSRILYAQDIHSKTIPALAVVRPKNKDELTESVKIANKLGHAIIPRGGGMSYSKGYVPLKEGSIIVDFSRMNNVIEINEEDMYVRVESGCTWETLYRELESTNLRTPFWGTLSGISATVGGTLSQNGIFWGSTKYGSAVDSVVALEVVAGDGTLIKTGSDIQKNSTPFFRHYGPDLTGLFMCDNGALGFKVTATMKLIPKKEFREHVSFDFSDANSLFNALSKISKQELVDACVGFDPYLQKVRMQRESIASDLKKLAGVMKDNNSVIGALKDSAKIAVSGRRYMDDVKYSGHFVIEERTKEAAIFACEEVNRICEQYGGSKIESSIPKILRSNPFTPLNNVIGPKGERWMPIHTIVPHSKSHEAMKKIAKLLENNQSELDENKIGVGFLYTVISNNGFVIEPVFFTPDSIDEIHREVVEDNVLKNIDCYEENLDARELTLRLRAELLRLFEDIGGVHMQIGKSYNFKRGLRDEAWSLIKNIKDIIDPKKAINPGALSLNANDKRD